MIRSIRRIGILCAMAFSLSACLEDTGNLSLGGNGQKTQEEVALERQARSFSSESRNIVTRNIVSGAAVGAVAGCALSHIFGGSCGEGALAGAVVGGVGGAAAGQAQARANETQRAQGEIIANLRQSGQELRALEANLRRVAASQNAEVRQLNADVQANRITQAERDSRVRAINANRQAVAGSLAQGEENLTKTVANIEQFEQSNSTRMSSAKNTTRGYVSNVRQLRSVMRPIGE